MRRIDHPNAKHVWRAIRRRGHLLHRPETALWQPTASLLFHAAPEPEARDYRDALRELVHRYLRAFGPATKKDLNSMVACRWAGSHRARRAADLPRRGRAHALTTSARAAAGRGDAASRAPAAEVGQRDPRLREERPAAPRRAAHDRHRNNGDVAPTVLVDGTVAAIWDATGRSSTCGP